MNDLDPRPESNEAGTKRSPWRTFGDIVLFLVGAILLLFPGGCAVFWIYMMLTQSVANHDELVWAIMLLVLCLALAFAGFSLIRSLFRRRA